MGHLINKIFFGKLEGLVMRFVEEVHSGKLLNREMLSDGRLFVYDNGIGKGYSLSKDKIEFYKLIKMDYDNYSFKWTKIDSSLG